MNGGSLQRRLVLILLVVSPLLWAASSAVAIYQTHHELGELYDTQLSIFARQLLSLSLSGGPATPLPPVKDLIHGGAHADLEDHDLGVAVWDGQGRLLQSDGDGDHFTFEDKRGFYQMTLDEHGRHDVWRMFYLPAPDGSRLVAVGQREELRREAMWEVVGAQQLPWLLTLPLLMLALVWGVRRGLKPLKALSDEIATRRPDDARALTAPVPAEIAPLVAAFNRLMQRVSETLQHERRFTADAAHELRTPLAGLRVQAEVAQLTTDAAVRSHALERLEHGIDRATRLVDQLLALSRLDPMDALPSVQTVDWQRVAAAATQEVADSAAERGITVETQLHGVPGRVLPLAGDELLLGLLLRNLLDNAVRYAPPGATVKLVLAEDAVEVQDDGPGMTSDHLARLGERFFRPPGQEAPGSGLGLSISLRVAELHGLCLTLANRPEGGLTARLAQTATIGRIPPKDRTR
ncbi:Signal transduction histidine kinase [Gulbenkiania indica]|uniref:histidine kinase n=1 Tax=Gulbenkiania indica TaxID=375574 RepID=A0A0K6GTG2_9NEIS|nr:ATP-binding protein [Gulbenkiania indica]CUA81801.1 Signal transduction histidine kinase [Gulbenkiania indica]